MRRLAIVLTAVLVAAPAAAAKEDDAAIVIGPSGHALVEPYTTFAPLLRRLAPSELPGGPFALVYIQRH